MNYIVNLISDVNGLLNVAFTVFINGGWVILAFLGYKISSRLLQDKKYGEYIGNNPPIFLQIRVDRENRQSTLAVEQIFAQLHAIHSPPTWAQIRFEGKLQLGVSVEIVSIGGLISYIARMPKGFRNTFETSVYARYPNAEIFEVKDYMENLKHYSDDGPWDMWGTEFAFVNDKAYPFRTYRDFEHPAADETVIDPLNAMYEALSKIEPHELFAVQYVLTPLANKDWHPHSQEIIAKLKGETPAPKAPTISQLLLKPLDKLGEKTLFDLLKPHAPAAPKEDKSVPKVQKMTEGEKKILTGVETKASKLGYDVKIRLLYIAPRGKMDGSKKSAVVGAFKQLDLPGSNGLKPDTAHTWTSTNYKIFEKIEKPYTDFQTYHKKEELLKGFIERSDWVGAGKMTMGIEEIATLFHFPLAPKTGSTTPSVEAIDVKKGQPPSNLPIAG